MAKDGKVTLVRVTAFAALFAMVAAALGGLGMAAPLGIRESGTNSAMLGTLLWAATRDPERKPEIGELATALAAESRREGLDLKADFVRAFPRSEEILYLLALDRDLDDFREQAEGSGLTASHYARAAAEVAGLRPLRANFAALFSASYKELLRAQSPIPRGEYRNATKVDAGEIELARLALPGSVYPPPLRELPLSHPYALDVFFMKIERRGDAEIGPEIHALEAGLVVAAAGDWRGGGDAASWQGGGLSPSSGNGVVIFSPASGRYYSYFHLSHVRVARGDILRAGDIIGLGGNTGINARKKGHGEHLHLEIFDTHSDSALSARQIRSLLF